jgi:hypothetical protein
MHEQPPFISLSMLGHDLGENIWDMMGGREHPSFWHGINNLEPIGIPDECQHQFQALSYMLLPIGDIISIWRPDHLMI